MSEGLIPSPPQLCSHVCQLHCLLMLMRTLPESILLVIYIISLSTAKTSNKACDIRFLQSLPLQIYIRCELMTTNENPRHVPYVSTSATKIYYLCTYSFFLYLFKILGTCHMCQQAQQKDNDMCI